MKIIIVNKCIDFDLSFSHKVNLVGAVTAMDQHNNGYFQCILISFGWNGGVIYEMY